LALLGGILVTAIVLVGYGGTAMAQEQQEVEKTQVKEEVVVTGTLIPRPTLEAMSPVSTMEIEELSYRGNTRLEDLLTQLPMIFVAQNSTVSNGASGSASIDLRNLGSVRTLVLIDGKRMSNGDAFEVAPDINFIPAALLKRVDVLSGGASATYGADAVAGVVNFILDKDFEGVRGGVSGGGYNHDNRNQMAQDMNTARGFTAPTGMATDGAQFNANVAFGGKFAEGKGHASAYLDYRTVSALAKNRRDYTNCSSALGATGPTCGGSGTTPNGRFLVFDRNYKRVGDWMLDPTTNAFRKRLATDVYNFAPLNFMQRPDQRYSGGGFVNYKWNEHFEGYADVMLMSDRSVGQIAESADFNNTTLINCDNPMLSEDQYQKICVLGGFSGTQDANLTIGRRNKEGGGRTYDFRHNSYRLVGGLKGEIDRVWSYDFYGLQAETSNPQFNGNQLSAVRLQDSLFVVGDRNDPSTWVCRSGNEGCAPWNIFTVGGVTQAALDYISIPLLINSGTRTQVLSAKVTGDLKDYGLAFGSAAEGIQLALGTEYRKEKLYIQPDDASLHFTAAGAGGPILPVDGQYDVKELFAEALIPIIQGARGAQDLSVELGYRWSDYNPAGQFPTYKAQGTYAPTRALRFRAGVNRATRAPNVVELFTPAGVSLNGTDDPCSGEHPSYTAEQCARTGVPIADYGTILDSPAGQYNTFSGGNPNLTPEIADTVTAGVVFAPGAFTIALDYYDMKLQDTIGNLVAEDIISSCAQTGNPQMCALIHRDVAGTLWLFNDGYTLTTNQNIGELKAKGVDLNLTWTLPAGNSFFSFNLMGTYTIEAITDTGIYAYDCAGFYGLQCITPRPEWRHLFRGSWETGPFALTVGWRYLGSVLNDDASDNPALASPADIEEEKINDTYQLDAFNYIDLAASFKLKAGIQFLFGVNNIFDVEPPLAAGNSYNDYGIGFYGMYDPYGRYVHGSIQFNF
jgi:outer membrane receptor protein involved in Fe transport